MTGSGVRPARMAKTEDGNRDLVRAIVETFNEIYTEMDYIEKMLPHLSDRVGVVREKMRRIDEYRTALQLR